MVYWIRQRTTYTSISESRWNSFTSFFSPFESRFCSECKWRVLEAYDLLLDEHDRKKSERKGFCPALYEGKSLRIMAWQRRWRMSLGWRSCSNNKHIHVPAKRDFVSHLIARAEPEIQGGRRERHVKSLDIAQEEILTCLGIYLFERFDKILRTMKSEEQAEQYLCCIAIDCCRMSMKPIEGEGDRRCDPSTEKILNAASIVSKIWVALGIVYVKNSDWPINWNYRRRNVRRENPAPLANRMREEWCQWSNSLDQSFGRSRDEWLCLFRPLDLVGDMFDWSSTLLWWMFVVMPSLFEYSNWSSLFIRLDLSTLDQQTTWSSTLLSVQDMKMCVHRISVTIIVVAIQFSSTRIVEMVIVHRQVRKKNGERGQTTVASFRWSTYDWIVRYQSKAQTESSSPPTWPRQTDELVRSRSSSYSYPISIPSSTWISNQFG